MQSRNDYCVLSKLCFACLGLAQFRGVISANRLMEVYLMATVYIQVASSVGTGIVSHPPIGIKLPKRKKKEPLGERADARESRQMRATG